MPKDVTRIDVDGIRTLVIDDGYYWTIEFDTASNKLEVYAENRYTDGLDCEQMKMPQLRGEDWLWLINGEPENGNEKRNFYDLVYGEDDVYDD